jgi:uncharacterized protein YjbI with pentapeptide repeats
MKKIIFNIILFLSIFSIVNLTNADFFEQTLDLNNWLENINFHTVKLTNFNLRDKVKQRQFEKIKKVNPLIKKAILRQYNNKKFNYYQTQSIIKNYNNFLYYTNKYFEALKDKEIYWDTKEVNRSIYYNFLNMKFYYIKFKDAILK